MIKELWKSFPRLLEQKINSLLDEAEPNSVKAFQLYKTCKNEDLWQGSFDKFSEHVSHFFSIARNERTKSDLDRLLERPASVAVYQSFQLNFRTALVSSTALANIASWAHNLMRLGIRSESAVISQDVLGKALHHITHPTFLDKAENIEFEDFCNAWKKTVFALFGRKYDHELSSILSELRWLNSQLKNQEISSTEEKFVPSIYLTQTEIDWTMAVHKAVIENRDIPKYPLTRGPQKQRLIDLVRTISLYKIVQTTQLPELLVHRNKIRATLLDRCETLLRERAR